MIEKDDLAPEENQPAPVDGEDTLSRDAVFDEPPTLVDRPEGLNADLDIAAALESVASLSDVLAEREEAERRALEAARAAAEAEAEAQTPQADREPARIATPPVLELRRGHPASVIPALLFIGVGAWLTFALSTAGMSGAPLSPLLLLGALLGVGVLTLLSAWIGAGRWSRGAFFMAIFAALAGGAVYYHFAIQPGYLTALLLAAAGAALALTGLLARPADRRLLLPGVLLVFGGMVALALAQGAVPPNLTASLVSGAPLVGVLVVVIWLLPVIFKRRG